MSFVLQRSPGGTHVRNVGGTKNTPPGGYSASGIVGFWPIFGMGTFNSNATPYTAGIPGGLAPSPTSGFNITNGSGGPCIMDDIWPNVYRTLTETWTDPGGTKTVVSQYQDYIDQPIAVTTSGSCTGVGTIGSLMPTITPTQVTQAYYPGSSDTANGTYTAVLSNQWIANSTTWSDKVTSAQGLLAGVALPAPDEEFLTQAYYPNSDGSTQNPASPNTMDGTYLCACANGFPTRDATFPPPVFGADEAYPDFASIFEYDFHDKTPSQPNMGGLIVVETRWVITGLPGEYGLLPATPHNVIYGQAFDINTFDVDAVTQPSTFTAAGLAFNNPVTYFTTYLTLLPSDVHTTLGDFYGVLGFQPTAA